MQNDIMVKGTVHKVEHSVTQNGSHKTVFNLSVYQGKVDTQYVSSIWFNYVTAWGKLPLIDKQRDVIIDGYFKGYKDKNGELKSVLTAKRVLVDGVDIMQPQQAPQSVQDAYGDLPF